MSELYELPDGWEWKSLDKFTTIKSGKRVPKGYKLSDELTPYPYIRVTDFNNHSSVDTDDIRYISEEIYQKIKNYTITDKDIYISVAGTIGKTGIIPSELNGANLTENAVKIVFDNELYDKRFLLNFTNSIVFMEQVGLATKAVAMPKLAITRLKKVLIPIPPLQEQKRIVSKLDTIFEKIDKSIALHQKNMDEADVFMGSVLNDVFVDLESKYGTSKLSSVSSFQNGFAFKSKEFNSEAKGLQVIRIGNVVNLKKNPVYIDERTEFKKYLLLENDIVISMTGTRKKQDYLFVRIVKTSNSYLNQRVGKLQAKSNAHYKFIYYFLQSNTFRDKIFEFETGAVNQGNISGKDIMNREIANTPLNIQNKTVTYLDEISQKIEKIKSVQKEKMQSLVALKASILDQAFKGEL